jgi:two-component system cell cycle sensor histidine kinase PleC
MSNDSVGAFSRTEQQGNKEQRPQDLTAWERGDTIPWERELLTLFVRNQIRVFLALPIIAVITAAVSLMWVGWLDVTSWLVAAVGYQFIQLYLCKSYLKADKASIRIADWIGMLSASEFLNAACWSLPLFLFWDKTTDLQHLYLIATVMAVTAIRIMIAANFMPIIIAGTGFLTFNVAIRCMLAAEPLYISLGAMAIALEIFFIQIALRLQETARDMLIFRGQKEELIQQLINQKIEAENARAKAEDASKAKSQFLATMSHELRTPLNAIMGFSEILKREMFGPHNVEAYKTYAQDIHHSGNYLLNLVNDILDLSRIEAGRREFSEEPLCLADSIAQAIHLVEPRSQQKRQTVISHATQGLPKLLADDRALQQIWLNLLSNAIKFTPEDGLIDVRCARLDNGGLSVTVADNGPGIAASELEAVLSNFSRGSYARKKAIDGAGLGLPITKGLMEMHEGELTIASEPGKGTAVTVVFPAKRVLDGPRGEVLSSPTVATASQRKLIAVTG